MITKDIAKLLGEDASKIKSLEVDWLELMREGVIVEVHLHRWRGKARLSLADLGITTEADEQEVFDELLSLGDKKLAPADVLRKLSSIDSSARQWLERCSFGTKWGRFVPATRYAEWKARNEELRAAYFAVADEFISNFETHKSDLIQSYRVTARAAYRRLKSLDPKAVGRMGEDKFAENFTDAVVAMIPSKQAIRDAFGYDADLSYIPLPSLLAADEAKAERTRRKAAKSSTYADALDSMNEEVIEQARKTKTEMVDGFIADLLKQLRSLVYDTTTDVLASLKSNKTLHPRSVIQLRNLVEQVKAMNFYGDREIEAMLVKVQGMLDQSATERSTEAIEASLRDIATVTRASLIGLGETPRSARTLGIANVPAEVTVRAARRSLALDEVKAEPVIQRGRRVEASAAVSAAM